jgi:hypothetical protein
MFPFVEAQPGGSMHCHHGQPHMLYVTPAPCPFLLQ